MSIKINTIRKIHGLRFLVGGACLVVLLSGLKAAKAILIPFMFAVFLALLASGPIYWLRSKKVPSWLAIIMVTAFIISIFLILVFLLLSSVDQFSAQLPYYRQNLDAILAKIILQLDQYGMEASNISAQIQIGDYLNFFTKTLKGTVQAVSSFVLIIIMMIFMVLEAASFRSKISYALGNNVDLEKFDGVAIDVNKYLVIKTVMSFMTGLLVGIWAWTMKIDFPVLWALVAFILNYIPFIGSIIAAIPAVILSVIQYDFSTAAVVALGYLVINIGVSNFIEPIFMGKRLGLSVLIVFLSLIFWGWLWGPAGALMSVPLTMIVKIFLEHSPQLSWVAVLMGSPYRSLKKT